MSTVTSTSCELYSTTKETHIVHLQSIEVEFKRSRNKYPISIQLDVDEDDTYTSNRFGQDEKIVWDIHKQFSPASQLVISITEHHRLRSDVFLASVELMTDELYMKPIIIFDEPDEEEISVKIKCETAGPFIELIRLLVEESQKRLSNMRIFLERLGKICETFNVIVSIAEPVSDIHPAAELAVKGVTALYEVCKEKKKCYDAASDLMADIAAFLPFAIIPHGRLKSEVTAQTAKDLLELFEKISRKLIEYSTDSILGLLLSNKSEEINSYKSEFSKLRETLDWCVKTETWKTVLNIEEHTEATLLRQLGPIMNAFYNKDRTCFEGSRRNTLREIQVWSESESSPKLFWLQGSSGSGKTTISNTVAEIFDNQNRLAGCFFCRKSKIELRSPENIMPTIAYQFSKWHRVYRSNILEVLHGPGELNLFVGLDRQFELLLHRPLRKISTDLPPKHLPLIIVLDGLDECDEPTGSRHTFADYIIDMAGIVPWMKVFVSSENSPKVKASLTSRSSVQQLDMDDCLMDLEHDITALAMLFTKDTNVSMARSEVFDRDVRALLSRIPRATQIPHATMYDKAGSSSNSDNEELSFDALFSVVIRGVMDRQGNNDHQRDLTKDILAVVCCISLGKAPSEAVLIHFLRPFQTEITVDKLGRTILSLHPIIFKDNDGTFRCAFPPALLLDFMKDEHRSGRFAMDPNFVERIIAKQCLETMQAELRFNVCELESSYVKNKEVPDLERRIRENVSEALHYSSLHWMDHVFRAGDTRALWHLLNNFFCSAKVLYWMEVLSLLGNLEVGKESLLKCAQHCKNHDEICCAATDLYDFMSAFYPAIDISAPHIYITALSWTPTDSFIRIKCCGFQSRQAMFAFGTAGASGLNTLSRRIGQSQTDDYIGISEALVKAEIIECSPSGDQLALGTAQGTLQIWDMYTGRPIRSQKAHKDKITGIAFSPDGNRIVTCSWDKTLMIWDAKSGALVKGPLKGHKHWVESVAYSPDGKRVASSCLKTFCIWDAFSGANVGKYPSTYVDVSISLTYSPDGSKIAFGCFDNKVRFLDAQNGALVGREGEVVDEARKLVPEPLSKSNYLSCLKYSRDGNRIVSGSHDGIIEIWDAQSGALIHGPIEDDFGYIWTIAFSRDGSRIISGHSTALRTWDAQSGAALDTLVGGECRWDLDRDCFVSIPHWWQRPCTLSMESLLCSDAPTNIPDDGWIRTVDGRLFLWIPPEYRTNLQYDMLNNVEPPLKFNWRKLHYGDDWTKVMSVDEGLTNK